MTRLRKKLFEKLSSTLHFEKTKNLKPTFKLSLNLSFKKCFTAETKTTIFPLPSIPLVLEKKNLFIIFYYVHDAMIMKNI